MWTKICGITRTEDAIAACRSGVDALGLNFYRASKRFIRATQAAELLKDVRHERSVSGVDPGTLPDLVGVFVNADCEEICEIVHTVGLTAVQCHGDESVDMLRKLQKHLPQVPLIRAFRISEDRLATIQHQIEELISQVELSALLLDTFVAGEFGGTGSRMSAHLVESIKSSTRVPLILAGGLTADNVAQAIDCTRPWGVDTASGVEELPGIKNPQQMQAFVTNARSNSAAVSRLKRP